MAADSPTTPDTDPAWGWIDDTDATVHPLTPAAPAQPHDTRTGDPRPDAPAPADPGWAWLHTARPRRASAEDRGAGVGVGRGGRAVLAVAFAAAVAAVAVGGVLVVRAGEVTEIAAPSPTSAPPPSSSDSVAVPDNPACAGIDAPVVTDRAGEPTTPAGLISAWEHAYYTLRDAPAALTHVDPAAGLSVEALAAGIASIPPGTRWCVGITPIAESAAQVHLAEQRPGGDRVDYLQLINLRRTGNRLVITNFQARP